MEKYQFKNIKEV